MTGTVVKLPITKAQRRGIEYRARWREQNAMIRAMRSALFDRGFLPPHVAKIIGDVLAARKADAS